MAKLAQQCLVCAPLGIHLEPINTSDNIIIINYWVITVTIKKIIVINTHMCILYISFKTNVN